MPPSADEPCRRISGAGPEQNVGCDIVDRVATAIHHGVVEFLATVSISTFDR
jgi:hypothetical protein